MSFFLSPEESIQVFLRCRSYARGSLTLEVSALSEADVAGIFYRIRSSRFTLLFRFLFRNRKWPNLVWRIILVISCVALQISLIAPYPLVVRFVSIHSIIHSIASLFFVLWAWRGGVNFAKYYLLVWPLFWLPQLYDFVSSEGILHTLVSQDHVAALGIVFSQFGTFLCLAFCTRKKINDYEIGQARLLEKEKTLNLELEHMVEIRTESLRKVSEEAIKANDFKDLFLANMGNELRTPLSALVGLSRVMVRRGEMIKLPQDFRRMLAQIHSGGNHLNLMLTNLMDVGASRQGKVPLMIASVNLRDWSQSVNAILEPLAEARGRNLLWKESLSSAAGFRTDQVRLSQVLINLVHNALKFSPDDGLVEVILSCQDSVLTLKILDRGCVPENPERLFQLYERHEAGLSDTEHGAGLGLYIVKTTLNILCGEIKLSNRSTGGACFQVTIPETCRDI